MDIGTIFYAKSIMIDKKIHFHYYVCVYDQKNDMNNNLSSDIVGLIITTNKKFEKLFINNINDYNVPTYINGQKAFICCDKAFRFNKSEEGLRELNIRLSKQDLYQVKHCLKKFNTEIIQQVALGLES